MRKPRSALICAATRAPRPARVALGLLIAAFPFALGALARPPLVLLALVPGCVLADYFGRWRKQGAAPRQQRLTLYLAFVSIRQTVVVTGLALIGRGIGSFFSDHPVALSGVSDLCSLAAFYAAVITFCALVELPDADNDPGGSPGEGAENGSLPARRQKR